MVSEAIDTYTMYDHNSHGRYEQRTVELFDDLYQIEKEWTMVKRILKVTAKVISYGKVTN